MLSNILRLLCIIGGVVIFPHQLLSSQNQQKKKVGLFVWWMNHEGQSLVEKVKCGPRVEVILR
jgi:hypothetical protein